MWRRRRRRMWWRWWRWKKGMFFLFCQVPAVVLVCEGVNLREQVGRLGEAVYEGARHVHPSKKQVHEQHLVEGGALAAIALAALAALAAAAVAGRG